MKQKHKNLIFRKFNGETIEDVGNYVKEWVKNHPYGTVTIGCDSQEYSKYVKYGVSILMHDIDKFGIGHGAHVIFSKVTDTSKTYKSDLYTKLWEEAELSVYTAQLIEDCGSPISIHLDYNSKETSYSNVLYNAGIGYVNGMGFKAFGKPFANVASTVSDLICRH